MVPAGGYVLAILFRSWALMTLWGWYVVPVLGARSLSLAAAFGLLVIATFFTPGRGEDKRPLRVLIPRSFAATATAVALGWLGSCFV